MSPRYSLILATYGRTESLRRTLESIALQPQPELELLVADQNADDRLVPLLREFSDRIDIVHVRVDRPGLSNARNEALRRARGAYVGFPDDDCTLAPGLLDALSSVFDGEDVDLVCTSCRREEDDSLLPYTPVDRETRVTTRNLFYVVTSIGLFARRDLCPDFDTRLGLGAEFPSCEEMDVAYRMLLGGARGVYRPHLVMYHPETKTTEVAKVARHAAGHGAFIRKHLFSGVVFFVAYGVLLLWIKPLLRLASATLRRDQVERSFFAALLTGRMKGFFSFG